MTRYLVTGGAGFIGSNLVLALARAGEAVRVLDDLSTGFWDNLDGLPADARVEQVSGDVRDAETVARACNGIEVIFHEAGLGSVPISIEDPVRADAVNAGGTVCVLHAARHAGVRRVVFAASSAAYGDTAVLPCHEELRPDPLSPYAVSKLSAENYLRVFANVYGLETISLRYFNIFGPQQRPDGAYAAAIPKFIWAALHDQPITIYGDGEQTRDFCFVDNAVRANLLAASTSHRLSGEVANVAAGRCVSLNALVERLGTLLDKTPRVEHVEPRVGDVRHSLADISRAGDLIGYEPQVHWEQGLSPTVDYLRLLATTRGVPC